MEQKHALADAARNWRAVSSAAKLAAFNGGFLALAAGFSVIVAMAGLAGALTVGPAAVVGQLGGLMLPAALVAVTAVEFTGRKKLLKMNPNGPRILAWNQLALLAVITVYCVWQILASLHGPNAYQEAIDQNPDIAGMLGPIGNLYGVLTFVIYGGVIAASAVFQGLCAWYYYKRIAMIRQWVDQTPRWITDLIKILS